MAEEMGQNPADNLGEDAQHIPRHTGSLSRRMIGVAAAWIMILLTVGGIGLDRILVGAITENIDEQMEYVLTAMITSAEIGPDGEVFFNRPLGEQRFLEPNSGFYWQISGKGHSDFTSRSLWDRAITVRRYENVSEPEFYYSDQFSDGVLRIVEQGIFLPGSDTEWIFIVAQNREEMDRNIAELRQTLINSFALLALGLIMMAALQTFYGLWPLRKVRQAIVAMRSGGQDRVNTAMPLEVMPMVEELNALFAHNELQAEEARRHAGNLAHALKTPLTVLTNSAQENDKDLNETVIREVATMRRQVDHHLARARAVGRRGQALSRANIWQSAEAVERAVSRLYPDVRFDLDGDKHAEVAVEKQDLEELLGNLIENAAKYGGGSVFVTINQSHDSDEKSLKHSISPMVDIWVEDDGLGIAENKRELLFKRGARLDTEKPGTGLGLAIVRDVAHIYGGTVSLGESSDLGGLMVLLSLPRAHKR